MRLGREEAQRIAASFAAIPALQQVEIEPDDEGSTIKIVDVVLGEAVPAGTPAADGHL